MLPIATTLRLVAVPALALAVGASAQAALTIPLNFTQSNSVQVFPEKVMRAYKALDIKVEAKGTATALDEALIGGNSSTFNFPITKIVIGAKLNIASGSAVGTALVLSRLSDVGETVGFTLANFTIDYVNKKVLADVTPFGGAAVKQGSVYSFNVATPLAIKYKFPLSITGHEVLDTLKLTEEAKEVFKTALQLDEFAYPSLENDFGTLTQDVNTKFRAKAIPTKPYVAQ